MIWDWLSELRRLEEAHIPAVIVTVSHVSGSTPREVGAKMIVSEDRFFGTIGGGHLEQLSLTEARLMLKRLDGRARSERYPLGAKTGQCCGGTVELLYEPMGRHPTLYLFGAGHVGQAVCRVLDGTPFRVELIDPRTEWIHSPKIPDSVIRHELDWDQFLPDLQSSGSMSYVVVMTHQHDLDQSILQALWGRPLRYLGVIGSRGKWERFKQRWEHQGIAPASYENICCPIGLPIGGKSPQEVAISVAAELLQLYHGDRSGSKSHD